jgi:hypothetical protein
LLPIHSGATALLWVCGSGEMADTQVLGTCVFGRAGSSPASRTQLVYINLKIYLTPQEIFECEYF